MKRKPKKPSSILGVILLACAVYAPDLMAQGIAGDYPFDEGIANDPGVLYYLDFDHQEETMEWSEGKTGYGWTDDEQNVFFGNGALEIHQTVGTHDPYEVHPEIAETDVAHVRWYRKWEDGYDFTQHKMPGVYAYADGVGGGGAGEIPTGYDKFSCKLFVTFSGHPRFYTYHPEQSGPYGDELPMNLVEEEYTMETERWYCFEMMIKANTPGVHDGEIKMWIDDALVGHYTDMRFRDTADLKINTFTYSAYVGGNWTSERDQKLWDDQIVVANDYIGPMATEEDTDQESDSDDTDMDTESNIDSSSDSGTISGNEDDTDSSLEKGGSSDCGCSSLGKKIRQRVTLFEIMTTFLLLL